MKPFMLKGLLATVQSLKVRQWVAWGLVIALSWTTLACGGVTTRPSNQAANQGGGQLSTPQSQLTTAQPPSGGTVIADGKYNVQQATYNDGDGEYTLFLLNTPPGVSATFRTANLQMAQLTPEEVAANEQAYLQVKDGQPALHIPKDFKLEYVHNVVEQAENPQTGQVETRIVRQESNFWSPFAGALAGQIVGNMLFRPQYYVPPMYQPGGGLFGYGGYGSSYSQASSSYRERYKSPPIVERNRTVYRSTRRTTPGFGSTTTQSKPRTGSSTANQRSTGTGFGSNTLRRPNSSSTYRRSPASGFGSGRSFGSRSFSGGRRR